MTKSERNPKSEVRKAKNALDGVDILSGDTPSEFRFRVSDFLWTSDFELRI